MTRKHSSSVPAMLAAALSVMVAAIGYRQVGASPSYQPYSQHAANDLYPYPAESHLGSYKSQVAPNFISHQNLISDKQRQPQQPQRQYQSFSSEPRAVINGNHATYVEPPVDFKPIIYEPEQQQQQVSGTRPQHGLQAFVPAANPAVGEGLAESSNQLVPSRLSPAISHGQAVLSSSSRQQQKRQTEAPPTMTAQDSPGNQITRAGDNDNAVAPVGIEAASAPANADSSDRETNLLPLKPSIDRWSDWHDMSDNPDPIAASDSQALHTSALFYSNPQHSKSALATSENRHVGASRGVGHKQHADQMNLGGHRQRDQINLIKTPVTGDQTTRPILQPLEAHHEHMPSAPASQSSIKTPQNLEREYRFHQAAQFGASYQQQLVGADGALSYQPIYYILPQPHFQAEPAAEQRQAQQQRRYGLLARSSFIADDLPRGALAPHAMMPPLLRRAPWLAPSMPKTLLPQRYGKKMGNLFRAASDDQQQHSMSPGKGPKRSIGLKQPVKQNAEVRALASGTRGLSSPLVQLSQQSGQTFDASAHLGKRVSVGGIPAATAPAAAHSAANRVITPHGQRSAARQHAAAPASSSNSTAPKRALKRRRIRTLVPVGLSSWFLGGIRDLDARHWQLPADVISKLAVNDVDLQHSDPPSPFVGAPATPDELASSVSNQVQAGGSLEKADAPRASTTRSPAASAASQLSPR